MGLAVLKEPVVVVPPYTGVLVVVVVAETVSVPAIVPVQTA